MVSVSKLKAAMIMTSRRLSQPILLRIHQLASIGSIKIALVLLGMSIFGSALIAQTNTASVAGTVSDASGAKIPQATVSVTNTQTGIHQEQTTDSTGRYSIPNLAPGFYDVEATAQGFSKVVHAKQELLVGTTDTIDFALPLSNVSQTITVTTATPLVDTTQNVLSTVIQTSQLDTLPIINRSFASLAQLSPGVQVTPSAGTAVGTTVQFGDSATFSNGYIVDGNSIEAFSSGGPVVNIAQDWIQEFSVITQQAPAEYGLSSAGFINAITRSGGNEIHGRAYGYFQNATLNATPSFLPKSAPTKPSYDQQRLGGYLGGPIKKNKLFYFGGYEWLNNLTGTPINIPANFASATSNPGVYPQTTVYNIGNAKIDYQINPAQAIHFRANESYTITGNNNIGASGSTINTVGVGTAVHTNGQIVQATWDDILSPKLLNEVRGDYFKNYVATQCNAATILGPYTGGGADATRFGNPTGYYAAISYPGAGVAVGCTPLWGGQGETDWLFEDDLTISHDAHQIKVGINGGQHNLYNSNLHFHADGSYSTIGTQTVPFNPAQSSTWPITYTVNWEPNNSLTGTTVTAPFFGLFAQDAWKVSSNLTLNIGLRYDFNFENSNLHTLPTLNKINNDGTNLAPRLGFAWSPFHNHDNTVIRGGFGTYYDLQHSNFQSTYYETDIGPSLALNLSSNSATLNPYCYGNTTCATVVPAASQTAVQAVLAYALANNTLPNFAPPGGVITLGGKQYTIPALPALPPTSVYNAVQDVKNPASLQTTVGVAQQLHGGLEVSGDFVYMYGFNQYIVYNANLNPVTFQPVNPAYSSISTYGNQGWYREYSLRSESHWRNSRGDNFQVAYTLTYGQDNDPNSTASILATQGQATDPFNFNLDQGPIGIGHNNLTVSGGAKLPFGLLLTPILNYTSPLAYTATTTSRTVPGCPAYYSKCYPAGFSKNSLRGASSFALNSRLSKTFHFADKYSAMLMFEGYNITNRANDTSFQANVQATNFTAPIGAGPRRQLQAAFQFDF
jgi:hypothetical protein